MGVGGGQWRFGRLVGAQSNIERIMYADNRPADMEAADQNNMLTVACEVNKAEKASPPHDTAAALALGS